MSLLPPPQTATGGRRVLARYRIHRGRRPPEDPLPEGIRQDTRKHTRHVLRPEASIVERYLEDPSPDAWDAFREGYLNLLRARFADEPESFRELAALATQEDVYLGCSCPTKKNPDVRRCHTMLALEFFSEQFPELEIVFPER